MAGLCQKRKSKRSIHFCKHFIFNQMNATPLSHLTIIPAFSRELFVTVLIFIISKSDSNFLYISCKDEPSHSSKAAIFDQSLSTFFITTFSYEALIIFFGSIKTDLACKHIKKTAALILLRNASFSQSTCPPLLRPYFRKLHDI